MNTTKLIKKVAKQLMKTKGTVTTLEIKNKLINKYPEYIWRQSEVSNTMNELFLHGEIKNLTYDDNGTYRTYRIQPNVVKVSRSAAVGVLRNSHGKFFTVEFIKKTAETRTLNGNVASDPNFFDNLGYIMVRESNGNTRRINPRTIKRVKFENTIYEVG